MAATTISAIYASLKATIEALDPTGADLGMRSTYTQAPDSRTDDQLAVGDMDREFRLGPITPNPSGTMFGVPGEIEHQGFFDLVIWHKRSGQMSDSITRMSSDVHQIAMALQKKTGVNYPVGVHLIRLASGSHSVTERGWVSILSFSINYTLTEV